MYAHDFKPRQKGVNFREVFVAMPFAPEYDTIFNDLIVPAVKAANDLLGMSESQKLEPYRGKDEIKTHSGWLNVLERLTTAQIVIGVLTPENANVFYELGIAHATQQKARQVLLAEQGYEPAFDLKDLIYFPYKRDQLNSSVEPLAKKIKDAIDWYKTSEDRAIRQALMQLGPFDFEFIMIHQANGNLVLHTSPEGQKSYEDAIRSAGFNINVNGLFERHGQVVSNLCRIGLIGLNTESIIESGRTNISFSYFWTDLGNLVLKELKLINETELVKRREGLPRFFD